MYTIWFANVNVLWNVIWCYASCVWKHCFVSDDIQNEVSKYHILLILYKDLTIKSLFNSHWFFLILTKTNIKAQNFPWIQILKFEIVLWVNIHCHLETK